MSLARVAKPIACFFIKLARTRSVVRAGVREGKLLRLLLIALKTSITALVIVVSTILAQPITGAQPAR